MKIGDLVKNKYVYKSSPFCMYGIITSDVQRHPNYNETYIHEYIWVLWSDNCHKLERADVLEVVDEKRN